MSAPSQFDAWSAAQNYELYMGRWSRRVATECVRRLAPPRDAAWLEIGCGTGALTGTILSQCAPRSLLSIDPSKDFVAHCRSAIADPRARFEVTDAQKLPVVDGSIDIVASGLVLNFIPDRPAALADMRRTLAPNGQLAFYVWDYPAGGIGFINVFSKAAAEIDSRTADLAEGKRFPFCTRAGLADLCRDAGFAAPAVESIEIETPFPDFEAFWQPFTLGAGPAPGWCASLDEDRRALLKARLADRLGAETPIRLKARAWMVKAGRDG